MTDPVVQAGLALAREFRVPDSALAALIDVRAVDVEADVIVTLSMVDAADHVAQEAQEAMTRAALHLADFLADGGRVDDDSALLREYRAAKADHTYAEAVVADAVDSWRQA